MFCVTKIQISLCICCTMQILHEYLSSVCAWCLYSLVRLSRDAAWCVHSLEIHFYFQQHASPRGPLQTADGKEMARTGRGDPQSVNQHFHAPNHAIHTNAKQKVYIYISKSAQHTYWFIPFLKHLSHHFSLPALLDWCHHLPKDKAPKVVESTSPRCSNILNKGSLILFFY